MSLITTGYSFGTNNCFVCEKALKPERKYYYVCSDGCLKKMPQKLNRLIDKAVEEGVTNADFRVPHE